MSRRLGSHSQNGLLGYVRRNRCFVASDEQVPSNVFAVALSASSSGAPGP
jgi:hypothetical protein